MKNVELILNFLVKIRDDNKTLISPIKEDDPRILGLINDSLQSQGISNIATEVTLVSDNRSIILFPIQHTGNYRFDALLSFGSFPILIRILPATEQVLNKSEPVTLKNFDDIDDQFLMESEAVDVTFYVETCDDLENIEQLQIPLQRRDEDLKVAIFNAIQKANTSQISPYNCEIIEYSSKPKLFPLLYLDAVLVKFKTDSGIYPIDLTILKTPRISPILKTPRTSPYRDTVLEPEQEWLGKRVDDICEAVTISRESKHEVPKAWYAEMEKHLKILNGAHSLGDNLFEKVKL